MNISDDTLKVHVVAVPRSMEEETADLQKRQKLFSFVVQKDMDKKTAYLQKNGKACTTCLYQGAWINRRPGLPKLMSCSTLVGAGFLSV